MLFNYKKGIRAFTSSKHQRAIKPACVTKSLQMLPQKDKSDCFPNVRRQTLAMPKSLNHRHS